RRGAGAASGEGMTRPDDWYKPGRHCEEPRRGRRSNPESMQTPLDCFATLAMTQRAGAMIVLIDNYDSFTFNLFHYLGGLGAEVVVHRNDKLAATDVMAADPDAIVLSPGP